MAVGTLNSTIDSIDSIDSLDELLVALRELEALTARVTVAVGRLDAAGAWGVDGHVSMAAWLRDRARMSHGDAVRLVRAGRFVCGYQVVEMAYVGGRLSSTQVQALRSVVTPARVELFEVMHPELVDTIAGLDARDTQIAVAHWAAKADALVPTPEPVVPERVLRWSRLDDGTMVGRFALDAANAELFARAIDTARTWDAGDGRSRQVANADAFAAVLSFFDANHARVGTPRHRPHVELTQDVNDRVAVTSDGHSLSVNDSEWFTCDCVMHRVLRAGSVVLDYGRATRTVPTSLFRAVVQRDGGCRYPGCDRPVAWCDAHHIQHWQHGGPTSLGNLVLLCSHHHQVVHRQHHTIRLDPDATVHVDRPGQTTLTGPPRAGHSPRSQAPPNHCIHASIDAGLNT
ncbi:MAG: HNH endonuclease [Ilumatobacteraceae bacterium]